MFMNVTIGQTLDRAFLPHRPRGYPSLVMTSQIPALFPTPPVLTHGESVDLHGNPWRVWSCLSYPDLPAQGSVRKGNVSQIPLPRVLGQTPPPSARLEKGPRGHRNANVPPSTPSEGGGSSQEPVKQRQVPADVGAATGGESRTSKEPRLHTDNPRLNLRQHFASWPKLQDGMKRSKPLHWITLNYRQLKWIFHDWSRFKRLELFSTAVPVATFTTDNCAFRTVPWEKSRFLRTLRGFWVCFLLIWTLCFRYAIPHSQSFCCVRDEARSWQTVFPSHVLLDLNWLQVTAASHKEKLRPFSQTVRAKILPDHPSPRCRGLGKLYCFPYSVSSSVSQAKGHLCNFSSQLPITRFFPLKDISSFIKWIFPFYCLQRSHDLSLVLIWVQPHLFKTNLQF